MVKIYSLGAGSAIEQNGTIQIVPRGTIEVSTAGEKIQLNRIGLGTITDLQNFWEYTDADGSPLGGDINATLDAISYFFFDDLEGYQQSIEFETLAASPGEEFPTNRTLKLEIGRGYQLEAKAYAKAIADTDPWTQIIRTSNVAKIIDGGGGNPILVGSTVPSLDPAQSTVGFSTNGFLFNSSGEVKYRVLANPSAPHYLGEYYFL